MGAVGCGLPRAITDTEAELKQFGYEVIRIKLSEFIVTAIDNKTVTIPEPKTATRYLRLQSGGNELRRMFGEETLAVYGIEQITRRRLKQDQKYQDLKEQTTRIAYLVDQIKHPSEVALLRTVYRNLFYLIGVMSTQEHRQQRLLDEGCTQEEVDSIIARDRKERESYGQQLERAFKLADYFVHHPLAHGDIPSQIRRFLELIHGVHQNTPTAHEYAMYVAYVSAVRSSCLSRQVGAVITDVSGQIIATGTNDVPKYKGGLYGAEDRDDNRCFKRQRCENTKQKNARKDRIRDSIQSALNELIPEGTERFSLPEMSNQIAETIYREAGIADLTEFSRAVHAEMDALVSLARTGNGTSSGGNLYSTTFPCHSCARHIVAAGIKNVYYIEPYEKSLALTLHDDSIEILDHDIDADTMENTQTKVRFIHFSGVGPRLYRSLFRSIDNRKNEDGTLVNPPDVPRGVLHEYLHSYREFETKVASTFIERFKDVLPG